ncbi:MlaD family protein [Candidatus Nitrosacidococcus tergens]|uniref:Mammalian cell entry related domain protein n=1 Tax=Candidatus Nitrosacidococcus tergens TaxID=553981 RepID=A0A7G1QAW3_9GAMM|nr:MlaD family protein [Candidatus Nitrosacidococcus tergens]CAB1276972.1 Mammalian cell entry related domain protein [Candidatus Nitrosacidococcus tergens]
MDTKVNYTLIGLFVIGLSTVLIIIVSWLSAHTSFIGYDTYLTYVQDSVSGLEKNTPVKYQGVEVGKIKKIELDEDDPSRVRITLGIEEGTPIKEDTIAVIASNGLTGISYMELTKGTKEAPLLKAGPNDPYPIISSSPSFMGRLGNGLSDLLDELTGAAKELRHIGENIDIPRFRKSQEYLNDTLANTKRFSKSFADIADDPENQRAITRTLRNMEILSTSLAAQSAQLEAGIAQLPILMRSANEATTRLNNLLKTGQKQFNLLGEVTLPHADQILSNFDHISRNLEHFSQRLNQNPSILLFGSSTTEPGPGE